MEDRAIALHEKERKMKKRNRLPPAVSITGPAAALLVCTTQILIRRYGVFFLVLQRGREKETPCTPLHDVAGPSDMGVAFQRVDGATSTHREMFARSAEGWRQRWKSPTGEETKCPILPSLPDTLPALLSDVGLADVSQPFSLVGVLTPTPPAFAVSESTTMQHESLLLSLHTPQPLTSVCINAINDIVECTEVVSQQAKITCVRRRRRSESNHYSDKGGEGSCETSTSVTGDLSAVPLVRLFQLSPYAPYALLRKCVNPATGKSDIPSCYGGEACEVLLVYVCSKTASPVVGSAPQVDGAPEVWGRIPYSQQGSMRSGAAVSSIDSSSSSSSSQLPASVHEEMFFIAASVEDYLRLGSAFAWVYGWQLCYAAQGPPPRSLPWLKLFAPSALAVVVSEAL